MSTFVSLGNATQPFKRLLNAVAGIADRLPQPVVVQHGHTPPTRAVNLRETGFMTAEEFTHAVAQAELVIIHAGAGSVIHALELNKVPVLMPRQRRYGEHVNDHQIELAKVLEAAARVVVALEPEGLVIAVNEAMARQRKHGARLVSRGTEPSKMIDLVQNALAECGRVEKIRKQEDR